MHEILEKIKTAIVNWRNGLSVKKIIVILVIVLILAAAIVAAIDPRKQFAKIRNSERRNDVNLILNAVYQYTVDNGGELPATITENATEICRSNTDCGELANLSEIVLKKKNTAYLRSMPVDPSNKSPQGTGYRIKKVGNRVSVSAPGAEQGAVIGATR